MALRCKDLNKPGRRCSELFGCSGSAEADGNGQWLYEDRRMSFDNGLRMESNYVFSLVEKEL